VKPAFLYLDARHQRRGPGGAVLETLIGEAPRGTRVIRVGALRRSDANRFHRRHGFVQVGESEWDIAYERPVLPSRGAAPA
jgi:L-amino acid N-acyltransferase YncA